MSWQNVYAQFNFNDTGSAVEDFSDNNHTITLAGAGPIADDTITKYKSYSMDANSSFYITIVDPLTTGDFTIEFWARLDSTATGNKGLFGPHVTSVSGAFAAYFSGSTLGVQRNTTYSNTSATGLNDNIFHHYAFVRDQGTTRVYVDGVQVFSASESLTFGFAGTWYFNVCKTNYYTNDSLVNIEDFRISLEAIYPWGTTFTPPTRAFSVGVTNVTHFFRNRLESRQNTNNTTWTSFGPGTNEILWPDLAAAGFSDGDEVIILADAVVNGDTNATLGKISLRYQISTTPAAASSTAFDNAETQIEDPASGDGWGHENVVIEKTTLATNMNIFYAVASPDGVTPAGYAGLSILILKLDDLGTDDWRYARTQPGASYISYTDGASVTLPAGDWAIFGNSVTTVNSLGDIYTKLVVGGNSYNEIFIGTEDTNEYGLTVFSGVALAGLSADTIAKVQYMSSDAAEVLEQTTIFALRLNAFTDYNLVRNTTPVTVAAADTSYELNSVTTTPSQSGDFCAFVFPVRDDGGFLERPRNYLELDSELWPLTWDYAQQNTTNGTPIVAYNLPNDGVAANTRMLNFIQVVGPVISFNDSQLLTWDDASASGNMGSADGITASLSANGWGGIKSTQSFTTGKYYVEFELIRTSASAAPIGFTGDWNPVTNPSMDAVSGARHLVLKQIGASGSVLAIVDTTTEDSATDTELLVVSATPVRIGMAVDIDNKKIFLRRPDGTWSPSTGSPAIGDGIAFTSSPSVTAWHFGYGDYYAAHSCSIPGTHSFSLPEGYTRLLSSSSNSGVLKTYVYDYNAPTEVYYETSVAFFSLSLAQQSQSYNESYSDNLSLADSFRYSISKIISDSISLTESQINTLAKSLLLQDSASISETHEKDVDKSLSDSIQFEEYHQRIKNITFWYKGAEGALSNTEADWNFSSTQTSIIGYGNVRQETTLASTGYSNSYYDTLIISALSEDLEINYSTAPKNFYVFIKDDGTARNLIWNNNKIMTFGQELPLVTVPGTVLYFEVRGISGYVQIRNIRRLS